MHSGFPYILLLRPPVDVLHKFSKPVECLALGYLAASARTSGATVKILDSMLHDWSIERTVALVLAEQPDVLGATVVLSHFPATLRRILIELRKGGFRGIILIGGHSVSFFPERILRLVPEVDAVVSGEGEKSIAELSRRIATGQEWRDIPGLVVRVGTAIHRNATARQMDLGAIAWPARDIVPSLIKRDGLVCISTSRGCYARCSFCSIPRFYGITDGKTLQSGAWLARSADDVVDEIKFLNQEFHIRELLIVDDEFFGGCEAGYKRALQIARLLENADLPVRFAMSCRAENADKQVLKELQTGGLGHVFIGLESGVASSLKLYGKGHSPDQNKRAVETVKELGLSFQPGFMLFHPRSTLGQIREDVQFLEAIGECKPATINSSVDPHFGAPLTNAFRRDGVVDDQGLSMSSSYLDSKVATMKRVAEACSTAFVPFMNLIAGLQSSITYEWRRSVPGRLQETTRLINAFETRVNSGFTAIFKRTLDEISTSNSTAANNTVEASANSAFAKLKEDLIISEALLLDRIRELEGGVRYWTQADVIRHG